MPAKKKEKAPFDSKRLKGCVISLSIIAVLGYAGYYLLVHSPYFCVKTILIDPSLQYIDKNDLARLKGQNLFLIDLKKEHRRLAQKYPQIDDLKFIKQFPHQIFISAKKRFPFAQTQLQNRTVTLDEEGVVLSTSSQKNNRLPYISGLNNDLPFDLGVNIQDVSLRAALKILRTFRNDRLLSAYKVTHVDVASPSKIEFALDNKLKVILDAAGVEQKMRVLSIVLTQSHVDFKDVKYIDLRFNEPIIGRL